MKTYNFYNGRSALDFGIKTLSLKKNSKILVPEIICDVAVKVFLRNELKIVFYRLDVNFQPIWTELSKKIEKNVGAILMVHFFGYPQNFNKFLNFSKQNKIYLIEDNCHSLNIKYKKKILGKIGDIGVDSPRKIIPNLYSGGRLYTKKTNNIFFKTVSIYKPNFFEKIKKKIKFAFPNLHKKIIFFGKRPNYESPYLNSDQDNNFNIKKMDYISENILKKINFKKEALLRYKRLKRINHFAKINRIKPIFKIKKGIIPMHFVGILNNNKDVKKILDWGWVNKIEILSWPSFYSGTKLNKRLLHRWRKYIFIPLNQKLNGTTLTKIKF